MNKFKLSTKTVSMLSEFNNIEAYGMLSDKLPLSSEVNTWGKEIYFSIPKLDVPTEKGTTNVEIGDVAYWPEGSCLCVFFGRTPVSTDERPMPASEVVLLGKIIEGIEGLDKIKDGETITVEKAV